MVPGCRERSQCRRRPRGREGLTVRGLRRVLCRAIGSLVCLPKYLCLLLSVLARELAFDTPTSRRVQTYHDDNLLSASILDILRESINGARLECSRRRIWVDNSRLVLSHFAALAFAFAFATFLSVAPRPVLLRLLAVGFVLSSYVEERETGRSGDYRCSSCVQLMWLCYKVVERVAQHELYPLPRQIISGSE
jgi:hypothetical protein